LSRIALVVAGGDRPPPNILSVLPPLALTIAADSGVDHARSLDLPVDVVLGDLDSASDAAIEWARGRGAEIEKHPADKDQTDLELALAKAARWIEDQDREQHGDESVDELVVIGLDGGRIDHWLANLMTLAGPYTASVTTTAYLGRCRVSVVRDHRELWGRPGELVTLLAVGGPADGVTTSGLVYPLSNERLEATSARGVSNVFDAVSARRSAGRENGGENGGLMSATVTVTTGVVFALQPHALHGGAVHPSISPRRDG